jgi:hypothetical protein
MALRLPLAALGVVFVCTASAAAQTTFALEGTVLDTTGSPVPNARVELVGTTPARLTIADAFGRYVIDGLAAGDYTLRAGFPGFAPVELTVDLNRETSRVDLAFEALTAAESLTVTAAAGRQELDVPSQSASRLGLTPRETPAIPSLRSGCC